MARGNPSGLAEFPLSNDIVNHMWKKKCTHNPMNHVWYKLKNVQVGLKELNTKQFSNIQEKISDAQRHLTEVQDELAHSFTDQQLHIQEKEAVTKLRF